MLRQSCGISIRMAFQKMKPCSGKPDVPLLIPSIARRVSLFCMTQNGSMDPLCFLQLSKLLWGTSLHLPSPGSSRTADPLISYHPSCWLVATLDVSWSCQIPQLLYLLCQISLCSRLRYTKWAENVPAVKSDHFRAIWHLISYICHRDT